jgi:hypothetical protein
LAAQRLFAGDASAYAAALSADKRIPLWPAPAAAEPGDDAWVSAHPRRGRDPMNLRRSLLVAGVLAAASWQAMACYTVYDAGSRVMYRAEAAPVDMSRPLHETVPARFPGGQLVFDNGACASLPMGLPSSHRSGASPLLTDRRTAQAIGVSYALLSHDIVMVPGGEAAVAEAALPSNIMVVPGEHSVAMGGPPRPLSSHSIVRPRLRRELQER